MSSHQFPLSALTGKYICRRYSRRFASWLDSLDPEDSKTGRTIVLSSHTTFALRIIRMERNLKRRKEDEEMNPKQILALKSAVAGRFERMIMNEGHKMKSYCTRSARAIQLLGARRLIFLSATPMLNRALDLHEFLSLLWRRHLFRLLAS